jgi:hypothetical protein
MKKGLKRDRDVPCLCVVISSPGSEEWKQKVRDVCDVLNAVVCSTLGEAVESGVQPLYVGSYLNEFDDGELDLCSELGVEVATLGSLFCFVLAFVFIRLGFLEELCVSPTVTMVEAAFSPCAPLVDASLFDPFVLSYGFERPFPQTVQEFGMMDKREFGKNGRDFVLVDMTTTKGKANKAKKKRFFYFYFFN